MQPLCVSVKPIYIAISGRGLFIVFDYNSFLLSSSFFSLFKSAVGRSVGVLWFVVCYAAAADDGDDIVNKECIVFNLDQLFYCLRCIRMRAYAVKWPMTKFIQRRSAKDA